MKRTLFICLTTIALLMTSLSANAEVKYFKKYADDKEITYVYISKFMLNMARTMGGKDFNDKNFGAIMKKLNSLQIVSSETKAARARLKKDIRTYVAQENYNLLMETNDDGSKVTIHHKEGKQSSIIIMVTDEDNETTAMIFTGAFTTKDLEALAKNYK